MMLLYSTGLRLSEALNLRLADIDGPLWNNSLCEFHRAGSGCRSGW